MSDDERMEELFDFDQASSAPGLSISSNGPDEIAMSDTEMSDYNDTRPSKQPAALSLGGPLWIGEHSPTFRELVQCSPAVNRAGSQLANTTRALSMPLPSNCAVSDGESSKKTTGPFGSSN